MGVPAAHVNEEVLEVAVRVISAAETHIGVVAVLAALALHLEANKTRMWMLSRRQ